MTTPKVCRNPLCAKPLDPKSHSTVRCGACAAFLRRNKVERPRSLTNRVRIERRA